MIEEKKWSGTLTGKNVSLPQKNGIHVRSDNLTRKSIDIKIRIVDMQLVIVYKLLTSRRADLISCPSTLASNKLSTAANTIHFIFVAISVLLLVAFTICSVSIFSGIYGQLLKVSLSELILKRVILQS